MIPIKNITHMKITRSRIYSQLIRLKYKSIKFLFSRNSYILSLITPFKNLCKFLRDNSEIDECTIYLNENGYICHQIVAKNWDIAHIIANLSDGNFLDMGSSDSYILENVIKKGIKGEKYGIDLRKPDTPIEDVNYIVGDLMNTSLQNNFFQNITCLSVIEHEVDFDKFASEVSRLLKNQGKLYLTFDYWEPKIVSQVKLYGLKWSPLDRNDVNTFIKILTGYNLNLTQDIKWKIKEAVITPMNHSPDSINSYTFGMLVFQKNDL